MNIVRTRSPRMGTNVVVLVACVSLVLVVGSIPALGQLPTTIDLDVPFGTESSPVSRILGNDADDSLGGGRHALAFGDIDGDGFDDVVIGAYAAGPPGSPSAGEAYVIYGSASLPAPQYTLKRTTQEPAHPTPRGAPHGKPFEEVMS